MAASQGTDVVGVPGLDIVGELGRGAHAVVYRVRRQGAEFALKLLRSSAEDGGRAAVAFRREAGLVACVNHPGVSQVYEAGDVDGRPYLVMDLVDGRSLAHRIDSGPIDAARVVALGIDVAGALAAAHQAGVVHRDVKPQNIVVSADGRGRLIDFGLATQPAGQLAGDAVAGTVAYAAPEQTGMLKRPVDGRSDLYSLGVVLFECLTGERPFMATEVGELIRLHATMPAPAVRTLRPQVGPALAAIVAKLLAKDPDDRYQTGAGLLADLRRVGRELDAEEFPLGLGDRVAAASRRPIVGRRAELARLGELWHRVQAGHGAVAVVAGPLGIGKTRLVDEFLDGLPEVPVLRATCEPDDPVPMSALRTAIDRYLGGFDLLDDAEHAAAVERLKAAAGPAGQLLGPLSSVLSAHLRVQPLDDVPRDDRFTTAVATFLAGLARVHGGLVLHLDGAGWLDAAGRAVVRLLTDELADTPLLLVCTQRTEADGAGDLDWLLGGRGPVADLRLALGRLSDEEIGTLAQAQLGGGALSGTLKRELTTRVCGNPAALLEYLRAMIEEGVARPSWGTWVLDEAALARLNLSPDVAHLLVRRVETLDPATRTVMTAAAAVPLPCWPGLLADICGVDRSVAVAALEEAVARGVVTGRPGGQYAFLHDLLPQALLAGLTAEERTGLHEGVAAALEATGLTGPVLSYALAHQYALGDCGYRPERMFEACYRAGRLALADDAVAEAVAFLDLAESAAARAGVALDGDFHHTVGVAAMRTGRYGDARARLDRALAQEPDPVRRAEILGLVARTFLGEHATADCVDAVARGLAELGRPLPSHPLRLFLTTLVALVAGVRVGLSPAGRRYGTAEGEELRRHRIQVHLQTVGARGAGVGMRPALALALLLRSLHPAYRVGSVPESVRLRAALGAQAFASGWRRTGRRLFHGAHRLAELAGDPRMAAHVALREAGACDIGRGGSGAALRRVLEQHGRWLDADEYLAGVAGLGTALLLRGYGREALGWYDRGRARIGAEARVLGTPFAALGVLAGAMLGRVVDAAEGLADMRRYVDVHGRREQRLNVLVAAAGTGLDQREPDAEFDATLAALEGLRLRPGIVWPAHRITWVYQAFGRLAQASSDATGPVPAADPTRLARARGAVRDLGRAANTPTLRAFHHCARAAYLVLAGRPDTALRHLERADRLGHRLDVPWLSFETARVRARALAATGDHAESRRQAQYAYVIATEYGWQQRAAAIRCEFDVNLAASQSGQSHTTLASNAVGGPYQRRLAALQEVSLAAATVLDPRELARVALDEIIRILGAERGLLFLTEDGTDELRPHLARNAAGADLDDLGGYGSTLVERVRQSREALVVTGSEQGAALGSESVVVHGLRSIIVAPLQLKGRLLGVVYLDNRVAKGVFTHGDVDILAAITHLIAASLETARAAELERDVHAAQQQRDLAELMRASIADIGATLDPHEVLTRLVATLTRVLPVDSAYLLRAEGATATAVDLATGAEVSLADAALVHAGEPVRGTAGELPAGLAGLLPLASGWLAIPLAAREERLGALVLVSSSQPEFGAAQAEIAAVLAGQAMIAYDNALLFSRVEQLATIDELTGVFNRRQFFQLAGRQVALAGRQQRPLAAMMLDVDHFKRVNDTHGHAVGDEVIRAVAARLRDDLREVDILGRYGGEEFAIVLPDAGDDVVAVAERLRALVAAVPVPTAAGPVDVTISVGVCMLVGEDGLDVLLARADHALYRAKQDGRNRVISA